MNFSHYIATTKSNENVLVIGFGSTGCSTSYNLENPILSKCEYDRFLQGKLYSNPLFGNAPTEFMISRLRIHARNATSVKLVFELTKTPNNFLNFKISDKNFNSSTMNYPSFEKSPLNDRKCDEEIERFLKTILQFAVGEKEWNDFLFAGH